MTDKLEKLREETALRLEHLRSEKNPDLKEIAALESDLAEIDNQLDFLNDMFSL